tara:strand:+ start:1824 stop:2315 length:492 start_codon:yes stop_codon:yes gene_type:complete
MRVLAVDPATRTGFAHDSGAGLVVGTLDLRSPRSSSHGEAFRFFSRWLHSLIEEHEIEVLVFERAYGFRKGSEFLAGLAAVCHQQDDSVAVLEVNVSALKKFATGKGNADKAMMIEAARDYGFDTADDNEADAFLLLQHFRWNGTKIPAHEIRGVASADVCSP